MKRSKNTKFEMLTLTLRVYPNHIFGTYVVSTKTVLVFTPKSHHTSLTCSYVSSSNRCIFIGSHTAEANFFHHHSLHCLPLQTTRTRQHEVFASSSIVSIHLFGGWLLHSVEVCIREERLGCQTRGFVSKGLLSKINFFCHCLALVGFRSDHNSNQ